MSAANQTHHKRFELPFFSLVPPWAAHATQPQTTFTTLSSLIAPPSTATYPSAIPTAFPDNTNDSISSSYEYVTTTDNIIIPITGGMYTILIVRFLPGILKADSVVQGPPQETIYPIATQGFNYYASTANNATPGPIYLAILWALLLCSLFRKRMIVNFES
ncbi:hypothetical protein NQZ79_g3667 [Umbelopsis isabellina]|nr:hypothetical protein NQZ79_g3667 [Umbelopsis isabellina]